jgi:hypothetical protein
MGLFSTSLEALDEIIAKHRIVPQAPKYLRLPDKESTIVKQTFADGSEEIDLDELIHNIEDYTNDSDLFEENGQLFVVYINTAHTRSYQAEDHAKWHVTNCGTLQMMRRREQMHKYARRSPTEKTDDRFLLVDTNNQHFKRHIHICKNCIKTLQQIKRAYREPEDYSFSKYILEFAGIDPSRMNLGHQASYELGAEKLANTYVDNWDEISAQAKKRDNYRCAHCQHRYPDGYLESHHKNRNKRDNSPQNLISLCALCHCIEHRGDHPQMFHGYLKNGRLDAFVKKYPARGRALDIYKREQTFSLQK